MNSPCMFESPSIRPRRGAFTSGSGPRQPHEFVVCVEPGTIRAPVPAITSRKSGVSGMRKKPASPRGRSKLRSQIDRVFGLSRYERPWSSGRKTVEGKSRMRL